MSLFQRRRCTDERKNGNFNNSTILRKNAQFGNSTFIVLVNLDTVLCCTIIRLEEGCFLCSGSVQPNITLGCRILVMVDHEKVGKTKGARKQKIKYLHKHILSRPPWWSNGYHICFVTRKARAHIKPGRLPFNYG